MYRVDSPCKERWPLYRDDGPCIERMAHVLREWSAVRKVCSCMERIYKPCIERMVHVEDDFHIERMVHIQTI